MKQKRMEGKLHRDNRGSGLVMVLVMVAFLAILAAVMMFAAYGGYRMRLEDKQGKNNFYTAESVLDEINVGLQDEVSAALSKAYQDVMANYSLYETPAKRSEKFYQIYYDELQTRLEKDSLHTSVYDPAKLRAYLSPEICGDGDGTTPADGSRAHFGTYGAIVESVYESTDPGNPDDGIYTLALKSDGIVLKDLKVSYVNQQGYVSIITTDIRIALPRINFSQSATFPDLNKFSLIADNGLYAGNTKAGGSINVYGNVYAKSMDLGKQTVEGRTFLESSAISFINATGSDTDAPLVVSKEDIRVESGKLDTQSATLWSQDIVLDGAAASLDGETYVQNDLKLQGLGSNLTLKGSYTGFGTYAGEGNANGTGKGSDDSSAILVNGRESSLDLSGLKSLNIGGHAFVSTAASAMKKTDIDNVSSGLVEDDYEAKDILMGESIAVKSNQLIYLVPPEVLGCRKLDDGTIGESVYNSNPMTMEQYQEIKSHPNKYVLLDGDRQVEALGYKKISDYMNQQSVAGGGAEYLPTIIVKQTNAGSLVYCFMQFKDEEAANQYFRDYYGVNASEVDKYTKIYADAIKMPDTSDATLYLHLAGNVLTYDDSGAQPQVTKATDSQGERKKIGELGQIRQDTFQALTTKMVGDMSQISVEEQSKTVFQNIVNKDALEKMVNTYRENGAADKVILETDDTSKAVLLSKGNYTIDNTTPANIRMVVALGNVTVTKDFRGIVMAGGTVTVCDSNDADGKVNLNPLSLEEFTELLQIKKHNDTENKDEYVLGIFWDGVSYAYQTNVVMDYGTQEISIADLIVYERWSKR